MLRSFAIQAVLFFLVFQAISFVRETSMLANDVQLGTSSHQPINDVPTLMNNTISLKSTGKKTVIYFFAPWCQICNASIGNLQALYEKNEQLDVIAVALDYTDVNEIVNFTKQHHLTFPIALGNEKIKQAFLISGYPSYYVINEQNIVIGKSMGYSSELGLYLRSL